MRRLDKIYRALMLELNNREQAKEFEYCYRCLGVAMKIATYRYNHEDITKDDKTVAIELGVSEEDYEEYKTWLNRAVPDPKTDEEKRVYEILYGTIDECLNTMG